MKSSIKRAVRPPEFISDRLLEVTLELRGRAKAVTFVVACTSTEIQNALGTLRRTGVRLDGYERPQRQEEEGSGGERGYQNSRCLRPRYPQSQ